VTSYRAGNLRITVTDSSPVAKAKLKTASVYRIPDDVRRYASDIPEAIFKELSQDEANSRCAEIGRLRGQASRLPAGLARERIARARAVAKAIPYPEFKQRIEGHGRALRDLPGTGLDALSARRAAYEAIAQLRDDNPYPADVKGNG
jgi:hypothetical protein